MSLIYYLDIAGTFAFAVSGALVATRKQFDVFRDRHDFVYKSWSVHGENMYEYDLSLIFLFFW